MKKKWLITGASSGIGREMAERLLSQGDQVFATIRKPGVLDTLKERYPELLQLAYLELTNKDQILQVVKDAFASMGKIDVIVSNAGYGIFGAAEEFEDDMIIQQLETNLTASIRLIRAVLPYLRKQSGGHIIQVSSEGGQIAYPGFSIYHASKWGIEGFVESVSQEVKPFNIKFTLAEPGPTKTNFGSSLKTAEPMKEYANTPADEIRKILVNEEFEFDSVEHVADEIINCARSEHPSFRLPIGKVAFRNMEQSIQKRLEEIKALNASFEAAL